MKDDYVSVGNHVKKYDLLAVSTACVTTLNRKIYSALEAKGYRVLLLVPNELDIQGRIKQAEPKTANDPDILFCEFVFNNARLTYIKDFNRLVSSLSPSIVVVDNDPASILSVQLGLWSIKKSAKLYCITCENLPIDIIGNYRRKGLQSLPMSIVKNILLYFSKKNVAGVFTINNEGTAIYRSTGFGRVKKIPLGFDKNIFRVRADIRSELRKELEVKGLCIGFFGRVTYEKGVHVLIDALSQLNSNNWTLLIDEFDDYKNEYGAFIRKKLSTSGIKGKVIYISPSHEEMGAYINVADIIVMPSISPPNWVEQYGRIAPEAMACGKLVIASRSGALPMLLNGNGVLVEENNVDELFDAIQLELVKFVNTDHVSEYAVEVSDYAHKHLSIEKQAEQMIECFSG